MSEKGIRYPSYATRAGKQRGGNLFAKQKVTGILKNPVYIGRMRWGEAVHEGNHPPIIPKEQFDRVQHTIQESLKRRRNLRVQAGRTYLLSGLVRCSCGAHMTGATAHGSKSAHFYYFCTRQNHEGGKFSCSAPRIPAEALEEAILGRIRELGQIMEAREKIAQRAIECLDTESEKLRQEEEIVRRQQQKTRADIGRLIEVLKSLGAKGLQSVQEELTRLESEDKQLSRSLREISKRQEPMQRISEDSKAFIQTWQDVGELLDAATAEEKSQILRHYVEVIELHSTDTKGGTYALRLFPEVRPDRGFDWSESPYPESTNGADIPEDDGSAVLTDCRLFDQTTEKLPD